MQHSFLKPIAPSRSHDHLALAPAARADAPSPWARRLGAGFALAVLVPALWQALPDVPARTPVWASEARQEHGQFQLLKAQQDRETARWLVLTWQQWWQVARSLG